MVQHFFVMLLVVFPGIKTSAVNKPSTEVPTFGSFRNITVEAIIDYIFQKYSTNEVLSFEGYEHLLESLNLGVIHIGHHVKTHINNSSAEFMEFHKNHKHSLESQLIDKQSGHKHTDDHYLTDDHKHTANHDFTDDHKHTDDQDKPMHDVLQNVTFSRDSNSGRNKRNLINQQVGNQQLPTVPNAFSHKCLRPLDILHILRFTDQGLSKAEFKDLCPALIAQIDGHKCDLKRHYKREHAHQHGNSETVIETTVKTETWLYACGAIVVISISGLVCVGVLSLLHQMLVQNFLYFLVALAVGALTGDAMLHLLPHALSSPDHGHSHGTAGSHDIDGVLKGLSGLAAFYFFFLCGRIQSVASRKSKNRQIVNDVDSVNLRMVIKATDEEESNTALEKAVNERSEEAGQSHSHGHDDLPTSTGAMVWRVIVGDGIHNFSDGLAIGVAFADSATSGLSTSIAVLCHELPHEIGDFALLLKKGMPVRKALCFNCLSSALSMIGVLAGVAMGNFSSIKVYVLVCVAGMFIYISLVDMLPEISNSPSTHPVRHLAFTMLGLGVGSGIMLTIALKEDELKQLIM